MISLAGIIHPSAFQMTEIINTLSSFSPRLATQKSLSFQNTRYKNLELGVWGGVLSANERKSVWAMISGSIHNSLKLKSELQSQKGYHFSTDSDAELIVHAYDAWQEDFISHLNGSFVIALFDEEKEILYLIRDRLGKKNLYWSDQGEHWLFSTDIKGLLSTGLVAQTPSTLGLASYLHFGFIPQDYSPIKGVNKLLPGHYLKVDLHKRVSIEQYWSLSRHLEEKKAIGIHEAEKEFGRLLEDAVHIAIPEETPVGVVLSGNPGSAAIAWYLAHSLNKERLFAFNVDFDNRDSEEMSSLLKISSSSSEISPEKVIEDLVKIVWYLDEPIADLQSLKTWHLAQLACNKTSLVFNEIGWCELLGDSSCYFTPEHTNSTLTRSCPYLFSRLPHHIIRSFILPICKTLHLDCKWHILRNVDINLAQMAYLQRRALFSDKERKKASPYLYRYFDPVIFTQRLRGYIRIAQLLPYPARRKKSFFNQKSSFQTGKKFSK